MSVIQCKVILLVWILGSVAIVRGDDGQSYVDAFCANLSAISRFDVSFTHSLAAVKIDKESSKPLGTGSLDREIKARLIMDRENRKCIFATVERSDSGKSETQKDSNGQSSRDVRSAATIRIYSYLNDNGEAEIASGSRNSARVKMTFEQYLQRFRIPLVEFSGFDRFPTVIREEKLTFVHERFSIAFLGCECRRLPGAKVQLQRSEQHGDSRFTTTLVIDPHNLMPVSTAVIESDVKGRKPDVDHMRLFAKYGAFNGIFLPIDVNFENREYGAKEDVFGTFGNLRIDWRKVNQDITWENLPKLTSDIDILRFIDNAPR